MDVAFFERTHVVSLAPPIAASERLGLELVEDPIVQNGTWCVELWEKANEYNSKNIQTNSCLIIQNNCKDENFIIVP